VSASLTDLVVSLIGLDLNVTCIQCSSPDMEQLTELVTNSANTDDVMAAANKVLEFGSKLLEGGFLQFQIDRLLSEAPKKCPHHEEYDPRASPVEYQAFDAADRKKDSIGFLITLAVVTVSLVLCVFLLSVAIKFLVHRRNKNWLRTISNEKVMLLDRLQRAEQEKEAELNNMTKSMFLSRAIPFYVRWFIPIVILGNIGFFLSGHLNLGGSVNIVASFGGQSITVDNFFEFSMAQSTIDIWEAGGKELAILILLFSGVWPYSKQLITLGLWFLPPSKVSVSQRGSILSWLGRSLLSARTALNLLVIGSLALTFVTFPLTNNRCPWKVLNGRYLCVGGHDCSLQCHH
jgi:hypothetical protein